jgi:Lon-like ATP-dependent protease
MDFETTEEIEVPEKLIDQVMGQDSAVEIIKKAAKQKRHILLIGDPGTGKSMLGQGMSELLPVEELQDLLVYPNPDDKNTPRIESVKAGESEQIINKYKEQKRKAEAPINLFFKMALILILVMVVYYAIILQQPLILFGGIIATTFLFMLRQYIKVKDEVLVPKILVNNTKTTKVPFIDGTGSHAGALLGDVRHDPFQSGGLETPSHDLVEAGAIHRANMGVLFIDEIRTLDLHSQQSLLTALQEKKYPITGQSERSSGAMVRTQPVPCEFVLIAAGNLGAIKDMHPALRSRIRGYGYEIYMKDVIDDNLVNRNNIVRVVAQEVKKDGKIPHFRRDAVIEVINVAKKMSGRRGKITLKLRGLGGLIRAAGDVAVNEDAELVLAKHVQAAKKISKSLEQQVADRYISVKKEYDVYLTEGDEVGRINGLAVMGDSGVMLPIVAEVAPAQSKEEGKIIATGKLRTIAREAIQNVSALIKKHTQRDISAYDIHIQFLQTYEGVEGDSASISVATAVISALENIPIDQTVAMTGSLSVRGDVLPVGGVTAKVEAAIAAGIKKVIIPAGNAKDIIIEKQSRGKIEIITVKKLSEVLEHALASGADREGLLKRIKTLLPVPKDIPKVGAKKHVL